MNYTDFFDPKDLTIQLLWRIVSGQIFKGKEISQVQHDEMRRTFYIGFTECFKIMTDLAAALPEDVACQVFTRLSAEANSFHTEEIKRLKGEPE